jgi:hypothetical protein
MSCNFYQQTTKIDKTMFQTCVLFCGFYEYVCTCVRCKIMLDTTTPMNRLYEGEVTAVVQVNVQLKLQIFKILKSNITKVNNIIIYFSTKCGLIK